MPDDINSESEIPDHSAGSVNNRSTSGPESYPDEKRDETESRESDEEHEKRLTYYLRRLEDDNEGIRWTAAESLGRLEDPAAVEPLIDALWDDDARVRMKAAWALGQIGDPRALSPLQQLFRIENENVKEIIEKAIGELKRRMSGS
jgi:HEAT repeat protein